MRILMQLKKKKKHQWFFYLETCCVTPSALSLGAHHGNSQSWAPVALSQPCHWGCAFSLGCCCAAGAENKPSVCFLAGWGQVWGGCVKSAANLCQYHEEAGSLLTSQRGEKNQTNFVWTSNNPKNSRVSYFALVSFMEYLTYSGLPQLRGWLRRVCGISTASFETGTDLTGERMATI